jgi:hypothetical protein
MKIIRFEDIIAWQKAKELTVNVYRTFEKHNDFVFKGSAGEVRSMLYLAKDLNTITEEKFKELYDLSEEISKILSGFIKTL